ncbi:hypothetical protein K7432_011900 [Basidiobolus ranarum]|uniref:Uncharacterized protein n=1 Tax=Basidiobolus ranarum TaxID=34480 RepID=A0ABR2WLJ9_9FUNG
MNLNYISLILSFTIASQALAIPKRSTSSNAPGLQNLQETIDRELEFEFASWTY